MRSLEELYPLYTRLRAEASGDNSRLLDLAVVYDGDKMVRISELDEVSESSVPNLVNQGIDAYARAAASVAEDYDSPPVRANIAASRAKASLRVQVFNGWDQASLMSLVRYQRFRYHYGYGSMPTIVRPHPDAPGVPRLEALNPINVLTGPRPLRYSPEVPYAFVVNTQSVRWVTESYGVTFGPKVRPESLVEVVEYNDAEQVTVFCVGPAGNDMPSLGSGANASMGDSWGRSYGQELRQRSITRIAGPGDSGGWLMLLSSTPNFAGVCTVSAPGVISLSKQSGFVVGILARQGLRAKLLALTIKGVAKGILPDEWIVTRDGGNPEPIREAKGLLGIRGVLDGADIIVPQHAPSYLTFPLLDRMEAADREETGIISEFGGTSGSNIRTGARGSQVASMSIDPRVREAHEIMQVAREHEIHLAVALSKGYGGSRSYSLHVSKARQTEQVTYVPDDLFETDKVVVRYPVTGADVQGLIIGAAQSIGTGMMSEETARQLNPLVEDKAGEGVRIRTEAIEKVLLANLQQVVATNPAAAALAARLTRQGLALEDVYDKVQAEMQKVQASSGPEGTPEGPAPPGSPETQPGIGLPGGGGQVPPTIAPPPASVSNLASLLVQSRQPGRTSPAERAAG